MILAKTKAGFVDPSFEFWLEYVSTREIECQVLFQFSFLSDFPKRSCLRTLFVEYTSCNQELIFFRRDAVMLHEYQFAEEGSGAIL